MPPQLDPTLDEDSLTQAITRAQQANNQAAVQELTQRREWVRQNKQTPSVPSSDPYRDPVKILEAIGRARKANNPAAVEELTTHLNAVNAQRSKPADYSTPAAQPQSYIPPASDSAEGIFRSGMGGASPYVAASALGATIGAPFGGPVGAGAGALLAPTLLSFGDLGVGGVNLVSGMFGGPQFTPPSELIRQGLMSIPGSENVIQRPTTPAERIAYSGGEFAGSAAGFGGVAKYAANAMAPGLTKNVLNALAATPATNVASGFGAGIAGQTAREMGASEPVALVAELGGGIVPQMASSTAKGVLRLGSGPKTQASEALAQDQLTERLIQNRNAAYDKLDALGMQYSTIDVTDILDDIAQNLAPGVATPPPALDRALRTIYDRVTAKGTLVGPRALNEMLTTFEDEILATGDKQLNKIAQQLRAKVDGLINSPTVSLAGRSATVSDFRPVIARTQQNYADLQRMNAENIAATMQGQPPPHNITPADLTNARAAYETATSQFQKYVDNLILRDPALKQAYSRFSGPNRDYQLAERVYNDVVDSQADIFNDLQKTTADLNTAQSNLATKTQEYRDSASLLLNLNEGKAYRIAKDKADAADIALRDVTTQNTAKINEANQQIKTLQAALKRSFKPETTTRLNQQIAAATAKRNALQQAIDTAKTAKTKADADFTAAETVLLNTKQGQAAIAKSREVNTAQTAFDDLQSRQTNLNNDLSATNARYSAAVNDLNAKGVVYGQAKADFDQALELAAPTPTAGSPPAMRGVRAQTQAQSRQRKEANEAAKQASRAQNADQVLDDVRTQTAAGVSAVDAITNALTRLARSDEYKNFFSEAQKKAVMDTLQGNWFANVGQRGRNIPLVGPFLGGPANTAATDRLNALVNFLKTGVPIKKPTLTTAAVRAGAPSVSQAATTNESEETRVARIDPVLRDQLNRMYAEAEKMWNEGRWGEANAMTERANALRKQMTENQSRRQPARAQ